MKKKAKIITVVVVVVLAVGGWLFYRNQQTIPEQFANKNLTTYDPHQTDSVMENHLGMLVNIALGKNSGQIDASSPVFKTDASGTYKYIKPNTAAAKAIYKVYGHNSYDPKDYNNKINSEKLGRVRVTMEGKNSWTLHSKKLTLKFHKTSDGHWATSDGTIWFVSKRDRKLK